MILILLNYLAVINFSTAFADLDNIPEYIPCERGWYYWGQKCYKGGGRKYHEKLSWDRALARCRGYGGDLASIESQEEHDFIVTFLQLDLKAWTWIGLNDRDKEGDYKWSDGTVFKYTNWNGSQPLPATTEGEDCVHLWFEPENDNIGYWNDLPCHSPERYICEMKSNGRKRSPNPVYCSSEGVRGWHWEDSCYHVVTETKSWKDAEKHCKNYYNGHLVSILDNLEDLFLDYISANIKDELWIGIKIQEQLQQKWTSGLYVSYNGFKKEMHFREGTCVARKKRTEWITIPCSELLPFICKVSKENPPVLKLPARGSYCPAEFDGWRDLGGEYCYYFETENALSFYEALFDCKRRGGNVVSLHSKEETDMLLPFVKYKRLGRTFYIGLLRSRPRVDEFAWTDGSEVNYVNWVFNQPDREDELCVEVHTHIIDYFYEWNDIWCAEKRGYISSVKKIIPISPQTEEDSCRMATQVSISVESKDFCISPQSYLFEVVKQSPDAKEVQ